MPAALAILAGAVLFALPALWNGFPFLFWDSGGYLRAAAVPAVTPGRSTVYGLILLAGQRPDFWPVVAFQCLATAWPLFLLFRVHGFGARLVAYLATCAILTVFTALPFVTGQLMPDIFAAVSPLSLFLLLFKRPFLSRWEAVFLALLVVIGGASHNAVLAALVVLFTLAVLAARLVPALWSQARLRLAGLALACALLTTPLVNLALAGHFVQTPGGMAFVFGRLLEDGLIKRYLRDHCPDPSQPLCEHLEDLPDQAEDFLWDNDTVFVRIGGMESGLGTMKQAVIGTLVAYPLDNAVLALRAFARQMVTLQTGESLFNYLEDSYAAIRDFVPAAEAGMRAARQQSADGLVFERINRAHVPVAIAATALLALASLGCAAARRTQPALACAAVLAILMVNAAVGGILSHPVDRYQARVAWLAIPALALVALSLSGHARSRAPGRR